MNRCLKNFRNTLTALFTRRPGFKGSGEIFEAARRLMAELRAAGHETAAASVKEGFASLNGLTDGWALFLEQLEKAEKELPSRAGPGERKKLRELITAARFAVYRR